jgi:hypothetical protein
MTTRVRRLSLAACCWSASSLALAGPVDSFDDIVYWTGAGANRAAVVIDFDGMSDADPALVWGFRWDGQARGRHMLDAVLAADARLYAKIGNEFGVLNAVLGLGYDRNDDGAFAVDSGESFNEDGVAFGAPIESEIYQVTPLDPADRYREGWEHAGFWHYGIANANPWTGGAWAGAQFGASSRVLVDGAWDSWAFSTETEDPDVFGSIFAQNPVAATPPAGHADFNGDHNIDGADFLAWQRGFGVATLSATLLDGDANGDGDVDAGDLAAWTAAFAASPPVGAVPEPSGGQLILHLFVLWGIHTHLRRNV